MVVTKRDHFLRSRVADPKDVETVVIIIGPFRNVRRIPAEGTNEVSGHPSQLVVLPSDEYECFVVLLFRKLILQAGNIFEPKVRTDRQTQPDCRRFNRGEWPDVIKLV